MAPYAALSDEDLCGLVFTQGDRLPRAWADEAIAREAWGQTEA